MPIMEKYNLDDENNDRFYKLSKKLNEYACYRKALSVRAKYIYSMLLDRKELSAKNGWIDEDDYVFIYYPQEKLANKLDVSVESIRKSLENLEKFNLIARRRDGEAHKIFVKKLFNCPVFEDENSDKDVNARCICENEDVPINDSVNYVIKYLFLHPQKFWGYDEELPQNSWESNGNNPENLGVIETEYYSDTEFNNETEFDNTPTPSSDEQNTNNAESSNSESINENQEETDADCETPSRDEVPNSESENEDSNNGPCNEGSFSDEFDSEDRNNFLEKEIEEWGKKEWTIFRKFDSKSYEELNQGVMDKLEEVWEIDESKRTELYLEAFDSDW